MKSEANKNDFGEEFALTFSSFRCLTELTHLITKVTDCFLNFSVVCSFAHSETFFNKWFRKNRGENGSIVSGGSLTIYLFKKKSK